MSRKNLLLLKLPQHSCRHHQVRQNYLVIFAYESIHNAVFLHYKSLTCRGFILIQLDFIEWNEYWRLKYSDDDDWSRILGIMLPNNVLFQCKLLVDNIWQFHINSILLQKKNTWTCCLHPVFTRIWISVEVVQGERKAKYEVFAFFSESPIKFTAESQYNYQCVEWSSRLIYRHKLRYIIWPICGTCYT